MSKKKSENCEYEARLKAEVELKTRELTLKYAQERYSVDKDNESFKAIYAAELQFKKVTAALTLLVLAMLHVGNLVYFYTKPVPLEAVEMDIFSLMIPSVIHLSFLAILWKLLSSYYTPLPQKIGHAQSCVSDDDQ